MDKLLSKWYWCHTHKKAHQGNHCSQGSRDSCTDVGPFSTKNDAEEFPSNQKKRKQ